MQVSINQLAEFTGKDRRTITTRLKNLPLTEGPKGAHLYESAAALEAIYSPDGGAKSLDEAKRIELEERAMLSRVRREELQRQRIPIDIPFQLWDSALQAFAAKLKAAKGKTLDAARINALLADLRSVNCRPSSW